MSHDVANGRRRRAETGLPYNTAIQAAHLTKHIAGTLVDRPLSIANAPAVIDGFRSLHAIRLRLLGAAPRVDTRHRDDILTLARHLERTIRRPTRARIQRLRRYAQDDFPPYARLLAVPVHEEPLPPGILESRRFSRVLVMIGPGIGIGDEIKLKHFLRRLGEAVASPARRVEIYSFCPQIWKTLAPEATVRGLSAAPLRFFDDLHALRAEVSPRRVLVAFATFMRQDSLRCMLPFRFFDALDLSLAAGEVRVSLRGRMSALVHKALDEDHPNLSVALSDLGDHLLPRTERRRPRATAFHARSRRAVRLVLNPFTSKHSPLAPPDWAGLVFAARRGLPPGTRLHCRVVPGLTAACRRYAREIERLCGEQGVTDLTVRLLDDEGGRPRLSPSNAIVEVRRALSRADLLLNIDTYTAHLAADMRIVSIALCLNRNVEFWDPAPHTFWLEIGHGRRPVATVVRAVGKLLTTDPAHVPGFERYAAACRRWIALGHPMRLARLARRGDGAQPDLERWRTRADAVWRALPTPIADALVTLDGDDAWPDVRVRLMTPDPAERRAVLRRAAFSTYFRLASLGAARVATREVPR